MAQVEQRTIRIAQCPGAATALSRLVVHLNGYLACIGRVGDGAVRTPR